MMVGGQLASRVVLATVVVTACLTASGDTYVLPDDLVPPTFRPRPTHHQHRQQQQQQDGAAGDEVRVIVKPEHIVMQHSKPVHVNCTASAANEQPLISFFWQILDDTSLPLSSSVPGVTVTPTYHGDFTDNNLSTDDGGGADDGSSQLNLLPLTGDVDKVNAAMLGLGWRFYNFLPRGDNKFGCLAYTMDGRRTVRYFTIRKTHF